MQWVVDLHSVRPAPYLSLSAVSPEPPGVLLVVECEGGREEGGERGHTLVVLPRGDLYPAT